MNSDIKDILVSILHDSIMNIRTESGSNKCTKQISCELEHLKNLLNVFRNVDLLNDYIDNISKRYIDNTSKCYKNQYTWLWNRLNEISNNIEIENLILDDIDKIIINMISIAVNNISFFLNNKDFKNVYIEAYHVHNLPNIIVTKKRPDLINYYFRIEYTEYLEYADETAKQNFEIIWKKFRNIYVMEELNCTREELKSIKEELGNIKGESPKITGNKRKKHFLSNIIKRN